MGLIDKAKKLKRQRDYTPAWLRDMTPAKLKELASLRDAFFAGELDAGVSITRTAQFAIDELGIGCRAQTVMQWFRESRKDSNGKPRK